MSAQWGSITAGEIAGATGGKLLRGLSQHVFTALETDSRETLPGQIFWALKGERYDGHDFFLEAIRKGASGVMIQEDRKDFVPEAEGAAVIVVPDTLKALGDFAAWWRHQHPVQVAVITGSVGKTTTKEMTAAILGLTRKTLRNKGNFNNLVGLPLTLFQLQAEHLAAVLEMGMNRKGEIGRLTEIADPDIGLITNVARVHLEGVGDIMGVARAKLEMVERISPRARVILNGDDRVLTEAAAAFGRSVLTYGIGEANDLRARNIRNLGREGVCFDLEYQGESVPLRLTVPGAQHVLNALGASAIALCANESFEHIAQGLSRFDGIQGRFTVSALKGGMTLVDDTYNSNPFSLKAAMESLGALTLQPHRVIVGLGEMLELGEETEAAHLEAGEMVARLAPAYFVAMGEHAARMVEGAVRNGFPRERTAVAATHGDMARMITEVAGEGDLVFLKGSRRVGLDKVAEILKDRVTKEGSHGGGKKHTDR